MLLRVKKEPRNSNHNAADQERNNNNKFTGYRPPLAAIPGTKPRKMQWSNSEPQLSLITHDIPGAISQRYVGEVAFSTAEGSKIPNKPVLQNTTLDIPGAQACTLRLGLPKARGTDPQQP